MSNQNTYIEQPLYKKIFSYLIVFSVNFLIVYFIGTEDIGLCFVITLALTQAYRAVDESILKIGTTMLLPNFSQIDNNINSLHSENEEVKNRLEELENKIRDLENKLENESRK